MSNTAAPSCKVLAPDELPQLASALRRRILAALESPASATALARRMGMSRQRVGYHMRALEDGGFIEPAGERARRGLTEKLYRARAVTWVLGAGSDGVDISDVGAKRWRERASWAALIALAARALRELTALRDAARRKRKRLATLSIDTEIAFATPAARKAFTDDLRDALSDLIARHHHDGGRSYRLILGAYPRPPVTTGEEHEHTP